MSALAWGYSRKTELKTAESVLALLHGSLAPRAPFSCDGQCPHVTSGATAEQAKRLLDSLGAKIAATRKDWRETDHSYPCYEDLQDELGVYEQFRGKLAKLLPAWEG